MVTKSKAAQKKSKVKVGKLKVSKETVKDLATEEKKRLRAVLQTHSTNA